MFPMDLESQTVSHKIQGSCLVKGLLSESGSLQLVLSIPNISSFVDNPYEINCP